MKTFDPRSVMEEITQKFLLLRLKSPLKCLFVWLVLWHINICSLFKAKSIFIQIHTSNSNSSVQYKYSAIYQKHFYFKLLSLVKQFSIQTIQFSVSIVFVYTQLNVKILLFQTTQFTVSTVQMSKTVLFQILRFSIPNSSISNNSVLYKYTSLVLFDP